MTFKMQAENFMTQIETRKRNPARRNTLASYRSLLDRQILPFLGELPLENVQNGVIRGFVQRLAETEKSTATILAVVSLVKNVVKSAVDQDGNQLYPRTWNNTFMDLPELTPNGQNTPVATPETIRKAISGAIGQDKALYALLAGSGLRCGEALALMVGPDDGLNSFWDPQTGIATIRTTMVRGKIQPAPKTEAGIRQVDLHPNLNLFLCQLLLEGKLTRHGLLFPGRSGNRARYDRAAEADISGFHSFRRFRITHLRNAGVPESIIRFWVGHADKSITDRYDKSSQDIEIRKTWTRKAGVGFSLGVAA